MLKWELMYKNRRFSNFLTGFFKKLEKLLSFLCGIIILIIHCTAGNAGKASTQVRNGKEVCLQTLSGDKMDYYFKTIVLLSRALSRTMNNKQIFIASCFNTLLDNLLQICICFPIRVHAPLMAVPRSLHHPLLYKLRPRNYMLFVQSPIRGSQSKHFHRRLLARRTHSKPQHR